MAIKVVMLANTPLAAAPYETMKCLNKYTDLNVRLITLKDRYADGRVFPRDLLWSENQGECLKVLKEADVLHLQNETCSWAANFLVYKKILVQLHSCPIRPVYQQLRQMYQHCYTIDQPMQLQQYHDLVGLPNLIDPEEYKPDGHVNKTPIVVFAPTNTWATNLIGSKGANEVMQVLEQLNQQRLIKSDVFSNLNYVENLQRKRSADIVIDDVVNFTFHRTALEAACFGCAVVTSYSTPEFVHGTVGNLYSTLKGLISDSTFLQTKRASSRLWVEEKWHPRELCKKYVKAYEKVLNG